MIPPQVIRGLAALAAAGVTKLAGEVLGEYFDKKARRLRDETNAYISDKQREFERRHRSHIERLASYAHMIRAAVQAPIGPVPKVAEELPLDLQAGWIMITSSVESLAPSGEWLVSWSDRMAANEHFKKAFVYSRVANPQATPMVAYSAAAFYAYDGISQAADSTRIYLKASEAATAARAAADQQLASLARAEQDLAMRWDNTIVPLIHRAVGPPVDERYASAVLEMADAWSLAAKDLMKVAADEPV